MNDEQQKRIEAAERRQRLADNEHQHRESAEYKQRLAEKQKRIDAAIAKKELEAHTEAAEQRMTMERPATELENYKPFDV